MLHRFILDCSGGTTPEMQFIFCKCDTVAMSNLHTCFASLVINCLIMMQHGRAGPNIEFGTKYDQNMKLILILVDSLD